MDANRFYNIEPSCQITGLEFIYQGMFGTGYSKGTFVEVGAFDGRTYSNTWGLAELGWIGIYIEPIKDSYDRCVSNHKDHPRITVLQEMVSDHVHDVSVYKAGDLYTIDRNMASIHDAKHTGSWMTTKTLHMILKEHNWRNYDLLVVDAEGEDMNVLMGANLNLHKPRMIIVEACAYHPNQAMRHHNDAIHELMYIFMYKRVYADHINSIYVSMEA